MLLSDGFRALRLDILAGQVSSGPARLRYLLAGLASAETPLTTLRRLRVSSQRGGTWAYLGRYPEIGACLAARGVTAALDYARARGVSGSRALLGSYSLHAPGGMKPMGGRRRAAETIIDL